ncbi:MAG: ARMT1-like domain-containing protein [Ignisphaera sp.]|uniref:DUF89 family protein n=1 Tax=Ignisphaera aggregans TaxID=334771 RepID=A0A7J3MYL7_9CREN
MWIDNGLCKLCLIYSRSKDMINLKKVELLDKMLIELANIIRKNYSRTYAFTYSFNIVKQLTENLDPYRDVKKELNETGRRLSVIVEKYLESVGWNLREALRISAAANIVDTSVLGYEAKNIEECIWDKPVIEEEVEVPKNIDVYIVLDNAGEAAIDLLLAKALKLNGYRVSIVVRKESYEIDILRNDIELNDIDVIETYGNLSPVLYIDKGFVIAKGIANAEAYIEGGKTPSLHLLRAKCDVIARLFKVPKNSVLIVTGETLKKAFSN